MINSEYFQDKSFYILIYDFEISRTNSCILNGFGINSDIPALYHFLFSDSVANAVTAITLILLGHSLLSLSSIILIVASIPPMTGIFRSISTREYPLQHGLAAAALILSTACFPSPASSQGILYFWQN